MLQPYFKDTDIPMAGLGLALSDLMLKNKTFDHCRIIGPAVFILTKNIHISYSNFDDKLDFIFIVTTNKKVSGVIALENVTFIYCDFIKVALIGTQEVIDDLKKGIIHR